MNIYSDKPERCLFVLNNGKKYPTEDFKIFLNKPPPQLIGEPVTSDFSEFVKTSSIT